ncbi:MAG: PDZ domain-containing protein [Planctomycetes bacterium]|nr:PDZ domain-containing protein [Planctomycetota bacterium]
MRRSGTVLAVSLVAAVLFAPALCTCLRGQDAPPGPAAASPVPAPQGRPWIGVIFGPSPDNSRELRVKQVASGSPAEAAGLKDGDILVKREGEAVREPDEFRAWIRTVKVGQVLNWTVRREGKEVPIQIKVGVAPGTAPPAGRHAARAFPTAVEVGAKWLAAQQLGNGAWPHAHALSIGTTGSPSPSITALALLGLLAHPRPRADYAAQIDKGIAYLLSKRQPKGGVFEPTDGMKFANYGTSCAVRVLVKADRVKYQAAIDSMVEYLLGGQVTEKYSFKPSDWPYGGWSYYDEVRTARLRADLSLASFVIHALREASVPGDNPVWKNARNLVERCQNWSDEEALRRPHQDGGFIFQPRDSKAGELPESTPAALAYRSYGTMTADGLRSLLRLGVPRESPRVQAAFYWLARGFTPDGVPGMDPNAAVDYRVGLKFYWCMEASDALDAYGEEELPVGIGQTTKWRPAILDHLCGVQAEEGYWRNDVNIMGENDPILATAMALQALGSAAPK